ncbi:MAG TPA: hypothetical protein VIR55_11455 [Ignavibacteria bacterium]|jgi:hypothetical protein
MNKLFKLLISLSIPFAVWRSSKNKDLIHCKNKKDTKKESEDFNLFI